MRLTLSTQMEHNLKELLKGSGIAFAFKILGMASGYVFILLITRNFGAEAMGVFALSFTLLNITTVIGKLGLDTALLRFVAEYSSQQRWDKVRNVYIKSLRIAVPFCIVLSALLFFTAPYLAKYVFKKEHLSVYFRIISLAVVPMVLKSINQESLRGLKKIKEFSFLMNMSIYLTTALLVGLYILFAEDKTITALLDILVASVFFVAFISFYLWKKNLIIKNSEQTVDTVRYRTLLNVSIPMLLSSSMFLIMQWTDTIMLGMFRTESEIGIYNVALRVASLTSIMLFAINSIAAPKFAEFYGKKDMQGLQQTVQHSTKLIFWTSFPILLVFFLFPSLILGIFGEAFETGVYALMFLTFGQFINAISGSVGYILQMTGKQKVFQNILLLATIINIILNAVLIPQFGINGAAFSSMVSMVTSNILCVIFVKKYFSILTIYVPHLHKIGT